MVMLKKKKKKIRAHWAKNVINWALLKLTLELKAQSHYIHIDL